MILLIFSIFVLNNNLWAIQAILNCSSFVDNAMGVGQMVHVDHAIHRCFTANPYDTTVISV